MAKVVEHDDEKFVQLEMMTTMNKCRKLNVDKKARFYSVAENLFSDP